MIRIYLLILSTTLLWLSTITGFLPNSWIALAHPAPAPHSGDRLSGAGEPPYPRSDYIVDIRWASLQSVTRAALGSDSWAFTWGEDGALYGAYGDGKGFEPFVEQKLSLGFVRVDGDAENFLGSNVRSDGERLGDGWKGLKPAGMLMVNNVLYLWARNAGANGRECQLARSTDHAATWNWSDWHFAEFGYCVFINFGQNYEGARDDYVYMVSHDSPHAYSSADHFILTRVPKEQILERSAYEFFQSLDANGDPVWTSNIAQRGSVFEHTGRAWRSSIGYNAGIDRYLWWQGHQPNTATEEEPGFGLYEAPEPWGPWSTVYYTEQWDMSSGDIGLFPAKWMSQDGRTLNLITSADDAFAVRQAFLVLANDQTPTPTATHTRIPSTPTPTGSATPTPSPTPNLAGTSTLPQPTPTVGDGTATTVPPLPQPTASITPTPTKGPLVGQQGDHFYLPIVKR